MHISNNKLLDFLCGCFKLHNNILQIEADNKLKTFLKLLIFYCNLASKKN